MDVLTERLNALLAPGVEPGTLEGQWPYGAQLNYEANVVDVQLVDHGRRGEVERALREEIDAGRVRLTDGEVPNQIDLHCLDRLHCDHPLRGGTRLNGTSSPSICTLGFVMQANGNGDRAQSAASHCPGSPWTHNGIPIGPTIYTRDWGDVDFKVIKQNNEAQPAPTNWVLRNAGTVAVTLKQASPGSNGTTICHTGSRHGESCGPITSTNYNWDGRAGFGAFGPMSSCRGDSGAAVLNNGNNRAYGIMKGMEAPEEVECAGNTIGAFTWIK